MNISYKSPGTLEETRFEKIHSVIFNDSKKASLEVAHEIADLIKKKQKQNKKYEMILERAAHIPVEDRNIDYNKLFEENFCDCVGR